MPILTTVCQELYLQVKDALLAYTGEIGAFLSNANPNLPKTPWPAWFRCIF
jgi:hypothetical protein